MTSCEHQRWIFIASSRLICLLTLLFGPPLGAQEITLTGQVKDTVGVGIFPASAILYQLGDETSVITFGQADAEGYFTLALNTPLRLPVRLVVRSLGYATFTDTLATVPTAPLRITLKAKAFALRSLTVTGAPVVKSGDTTTFYTGAFATRQDFSIADVLRRMPGVEVAENGTVSYQGKRISEYTVEHLDLMGGRYNVINRNLPHQEVGKIQFIENHQRIRSLEGKEDSDAVKLNIDLKKEQVFTGEAKAAAAYAPLQGAVNVTPMLFQTGGQSVLDLQADALGKDLREDYAVLTVDEYIRRGYTASVTPEFSRILYPREIDLPSRFWLRNQGESLSLNHLRPVGKRDGLLRINASLYRLQLLHQSETQLSFLNGTSDRVDFTETFEATSTEKRLDVALTYERNAEKHYLKNSLRVTLDDLSGAGANAYPLRNAAVPQRSDNADYNIELRSHVVRTLRPDLTRQIEAYGIGVKSAQALDFSREGDRTTQALIFARYAGGGLHKYSFQRGKIRYWCSQYLDLKHESLTPTLRTAPSGTIPPGDDRPFTVTDFSGGGALGLSAKVAAWQLEMTTDLRYLRQGLEYEARQQRGIVAIEPELSVRYRPPSRWQYQFGAALKNDFTPLISQAPFFYFQDFRTLQNSIGITEKTLALRQYFQMEYQDPAEGLFARWRLHHSLRRNELRSEVIFTSPIARTLNQVFDPSWQNATTLSAGGSKAFRAAGLSLNFDGQAGRGRVPVVFNGVAANAIVRYAGFRAGLRYRPVDWFFLNLKHQQDYRLNQQRRSNRDEQPAVSASGRFSLSSIFTLGTVSLSASGEHFAQRLRDERLASTLFNLLARTTLANGRWSIEIEGRNLTNADFITYPLTTDVYSGFTRLPLRGRQLILSVRTSLSRPGAAPAAE